MLSRIQQDTSGFGVATRDPGSSFLKPSVGQSSQKTLSSLTSHVWMCVPIGRWGELFTIVPRTTRSALISSQKQDPDLRSVQIGGHFFEPSFRWAEAKRIADATKSRKKRCQMILLLLTGVGGDFSADQDEMRDQVFDALSSLEFATKNLDELTDHLVATSYTPAEWHYDQSLGWINDGRYTLRCINTNLSLSRDQFLMLRRFFRSLP